MEIERKFLIPGFPEFLPEIERAQVWQGYISTRPVVRIRKKQQENKTSYKLCFKGEGLLSRQETELAIEEAVFEELQNLLQKPMIHKDFRVYELDGYQLECSRVEGKGNPEFFYAEIEFSSEEEAKAFQPPAFLQKEVTFEKGYTMRDYWERMRSNE